MDRSTQRTWRPTTTAIAWQRAAAIIACCAALVAGSREAYAVTCPGVNLCNWNPTTATVLTQPKVYVVWWAGAGASTWNDPKGLQPVMRGFLQNLGGSKYLNTVTQYNSWNGTCGNPVDLWGGEVTDTVNPRPANNGWPSDGQFQAEVTWALGQFTPAPPADAIVVVAMPSPVYNIGECGRHISAPRSGFATTALVMMEYQDAEFCNPVTTAADQATDTLEHEISEAITDPRWYDGPTQMAWLTTGKTEVADKCQNGSVFSVGLSATSNYVVPSLWSNAANGNQGGCVESYSTRQDRFYLGGDGNVWRNWSGTSWDNFSHPSGATLNSPPTAVSWSNGRIDLFVRATDNTLRHAPYVGTVPPGWNSWGALPSPWTMFGEPDAASWKKTRLDVFVLGNNGSTNHVFHKYHDNGFTSGWQDWGAPSGAPYVNMGPTAVSWGPSRIDLYILGGDSHLWHGYCTSTTQCNTAPQNWNDWGTGPSGKVLSGYPTAASWGDQRLDVFVMQTDGNIAHRWYDHGGSGWDTWAKPTQGNFASDPGAVAGGDGRLFVDAKGPSGAIWEQTYNFGMGTWQNKGNGASVGTTPDLSAW